MREKKADKVTLVIINLVMQSLPEGLQIPDKKQYIKRLSDELAEAYCSAKRIVLKD